MKRLLSSLKAAAQCVKSWWRVDRILSELRAKRANVSTELLQIQSRIAKHETELSEAKREFVAAQEKPVVWFSYHPEWEETANKPVGLPDGTIQRGTKDSTHMLGGGLVRIAIKPESAPIDWTQFKKLSGIDAENVKSLTNAAFSCDMSPRDWRCSFDPVSDSDWLSIEYWDGEAWSDEPPY